MPKRIIITEDQYKGILDWSKKCYLLSEAIKEELSINNEVLVTVNRLVSEIDDKIKKTDKVKITNGVFKQKIQLDKITLNGYKILVSVVNFDFIDRKFFDEKFQEYENYLKGSETSPFIKNKTFFIFLRTCSISGGLVKDVSVDNLQHELEHCFQMAASQEILPKDENYSIAYNILKSQVNESSLDLIVAKALYYSYSFEQDGFVNGLYQYLQKFETPLVDMSDIIDSSACQSYFNLKKLIKDIKAFDRKSVEDILITTYSGLHYDKFLAQLDKSLARFIKKIGKVLTLHRMTAIKNGARLNEMMDGDIYFV